MPNKQKLKNKGNYFGNLTGKPQEQRLQDNRTRVSLVTLASLYIVTFGETLGIHLKILYFETATIVSLTGIKGFVGVFIITVAGKKIQNKNTMVSCHISSPRVA